MPWQSSRTRGKTSTHARCATKSRVLVADLAGLSAANFDGNGQAGEAAIVSGETTRAEFGLRQLMTKAVVSSMRAVQGHMVNAHGTLLGTFFILHLRTADGGLDAAQIVLLRTGWTLARGVMAAERVTVHVEGAARVIARKILHTMSPSRAVDHGGGTPFDGLVAC